MAGNPATQVSFGFNDKSFAEAGLETGSSLPPVGTPRRISGLTHADRMTSSVSIHMIDRHAGLGNGMGGQLMRSALGSSAYAPLDPYERARQLRSEPSPKIMRERKVTRLRDGLSDGIDTRYEVRQLPRSAELQDGAEPQGMFKQLLLSDLTWATEPTAPEDLVAISEHRWSFRGAVELAQRGQSFSFFIRCLLDMQMNLQCDEDADALDPKLSRACKAFVTGQCGTGQSGEMYQLLTHFVCNAVIFDEWDRYLKDAFAHERANQEAFLVPHLEQVWARFCRMLPTLEEIFDVLNTRFVWRHRLPKVGDVVRESMKRRCFSSKSVNQNEMFTQEKCNNETVKNIKRAFKIGQ
jgi:hypothetical protein